MLNTEDQKSLEKVLRLAPVPEQTFTYDEVLGYIFGLAMTPDGISPNEWVPIIFGGNMGASNPVVPDEEHSRFLVEVYDTFSSKFQMGQLKFPYTITTLQQEDCERIFGWVSGFDEALFLRPHLWEPDEFPEIPEKNREELVFSTMVVKGLVDPAEVSMFFDKLPDEVLQSAIADSNEDQEEREDMIQAFLYATLPLAVKTLMEHARYQVQHG